MSLCGVSRTYLAYAWYSASLVAGRARSCSTVQQRDEADEQPDWPAEQHEECEFAGSHGEAFGAAVSDTVQSAPTVTVPFGLVLLSNCT